VNAYPTSGNPLRTLVELVGAVFTGVLGSATLITGHDVDIELARAADLERLRQFFEQPEQHHFDPRDGVIHVVLDLAGIDAMTKSASARHPASSRLFA